MRGYARGPSQEDWRLEAVVSAFRMGRLSFVFRHTEFEAMRGYSISENSFRATWDT